MTLGRARLAVAAAALVGVAGAACAADPDGPPAVYDAELLAGGADEYGDGFIELPDYSDVDLVPGAQGGFHVWVNVRVHGIEGPVVIEREARRVNDGALVLRGVEQPLDVPTDAMEDWWESPTGTPAFMCPTPIGLSILDEPIRITIRL